MYVFVVMDLNLLKKLFVSAALLVPCFFSYAQMTERSVELHFRQGSSKYEPNYRGNAERLRQFSDEIVSLHRDKYEITSAEFRAGTSPEGSERVNTRLSGERLRNGIAAFLAVMGDDIVLHGEELTVSSASAGTWEDLAASLRQAKTSMAAPPFSKSCETAVLPTTPRRQLSIVWGSLSEK